MSETIPDETQNAESRVELEGGTYEIIRHRLVAQGKELRSRLAQLNEARRSVFGAIETELIETARITTEHNCEPRDMIVVGRYWLFGYNIHFGLKTETNLKDVFSVYEFSEGTFHQQPLTLIQDEKFTRDFAEVYRYYKQAVFAKFMRRGPHLYMVFRVGKSPSDIKSFKWAVAGDELHYLDNRSDHEVRYPPQHQFDWVRTTRDMHHFGMHPHISIEERVFVETVGGDLTIKVENNTASGEGIYAEPVDNPDQTLDDAEVLYAIVGNIILLKIRPYQEKAYRYIAYNEKINRAGRLDAIADACVLLPDDQGLIFSNGYYLQTGESKTFGNELTQMMFERRVAAPNGEDFLYIFYNRESGTNILLPYHLIEQRVDTPVICNGFTIFASGEMICFQAQAEAQKHHALQIWRTPYVGEDLVPTTQTDSYLAKIGNRDIVRGMAECHEVLTLIEREDVYASLYIDIVKETTDVLDSYFWLGSNETFQLKEPLAAIKATAASAIDEFEKVVRAKRNTAEQTKQASTKAREVLGKIHHRRFVHINEFVESLAALRHIRGEIISLRDLRYVEGATVDQLEAEVGEHTERLSHRCVEFLLQPDSLQPYADHVAAQTAQIDGLSKASEAKELQELIAASASELEMLIEIVSNLKIEDATHRTTIVDNISTIFGVINQARAALKRKLKELASVEGVAEFNSQLKLLNQGVINYLDICDTPRKCEEYLTKVMIQLEELEGRFAEFDEFILQLTEKREEIGLLRFHTQSRALARVFWNHFVDRKQKSLMAAKLQGCGVIGTLFPTARQQEHYIRDLAATLQAFVEEEQLFAPTLVEEAAEYLYHELSTGNDFVVSRVASEVYDAFHSHLSTHGYVEKFADTLQKLKHDAAASLVLARDWVQAFITSQPAGDSSESLDYIDEVAALLMAGKLNRTQIVDGRVAHELTDMSGSHAVIVERRYHLHFNRFTRKLHQFDRDVVPRFRRYVALNKEIVDAARNEMRLDEFRPRVLTSFVRNKLIDSVYLPLIGDNLAKQIGVVGEQKRTDLMELLLLVSPPGYGKTTLMEYLANRLGVIFMKINGPVLGHHITSLDPTEATNAAAREEVEKLNVALEMGDNVMIYVDDIQHCNPEFLQKFISLCDTQRKIEGVYKGRTRTYDLRGRTVAVVMAGNPYTESGDKFQIPDMLANRADVYNLGEIIGDNADVFEMSYLENALTSNPVLNKLASRSQADVYEVMRLAQYDKHEDVNLEGNYSLEELNEMVAVMKKLMRVRDLVLAVNREYIRSAAQSDDYRTEPPFKLQGSYRNMNRIAEKVVPIMNDEELQTLILSSYENDAQTLTSDQEANMLKFKELMGILTPAEADRWDDIKRTFAQNVKLRGVDAGSEVAQVLVQLGSLNDGLHAIRRALVEGVGQLTAPDADAAQTQEQVARVVEELQSLNNGMTSIGTVLNSGVERLNQSSNTDPTLAAEALAPLLKQLQASAAGKEMSDETRRLIVQYRVPKEVVGVLQHLMQAWMLPILNAANLQSADIQRLEESLKTTLNSYATLVEHLEDLPQRPPSA